MKKIFRAEYLQKHWESGKPIIHKGKKYRIGKMSYGNFFFEPIRKGYPLGRGEKYPFERGTLWLEKVEKKPFLYRLEKVI